MKLESKTILVSIGIIRALFRKGLPHFKSHYKFPTDIVNTSSNRRIKYVYNTPTYVARRNM